MKKTVFTAVALCSSFWLAGQSCCDLARPDAHAPITVMGDHLHPKGEAMFGYHFHFMNMDHPQDPSSGHVHGSGGMDMRMHMAEFMYGLSKNWTGMVMLSYLNNSMAGVKTDQAFLKSIGDVQLGGMFNLFKKQKIAAHGQLMASLPTGSIDQRQKTNKGNLQLPYMMQLGSGTFDLMPGATFLWQLPRYSGGFQTIETVRFGKNKNGYRFGNHFGATAWAARRLGCRLSVSVSSAFHYQTAMSGRDPEISDAFLIPEGMHVSCSVGLNFRFNNGFLKGHRLGLEAAAPVYYSADLNRQRSNWEVSGGWQKSRKFR